MTAPWTSIGWYHGTTTSLQYHFWMITLPCFGVHGTFRYHNATSTKNVLFIVHSSVSVLFFIITLNSNAVWYTYHLNNCY